MADGSTTTTPTSETPKIERPERPETAATTATTKAQKSKVKSRWTKSFFNNLIETNASGGIRYICDVCHKDFSSTSNLTLHRSTHVIERRYKCEPCQVSFHSQGHLQKHKRSSAHETRVEMTQSFGVPTSDNPRPYGCTECDTAFRKHGHLAKHLRSKSHFTRLESSGLIPMGTYAALEKCGADLKDKLVTTNCEQSLQSIRHIATILFQNALISSPPASVMSSCSGGRVSGSSGSGSGSSTYSHSDNSSTCTLMYQQQPASVAASDRSYLSSVASPQTTPPLHSIASSGSNSAPFAHHLQHQITSPPPPPPPPTSSHCFRDNNSIVGVSTPPPPAASSSMLHNQVQLQSIDYSMRAQPFTTSTGLTTPTTAITTTAAAISPPPPLLGPPADGQQSYGQDCFNNNHLGQQQQLPLDFNLNRQLPFSSVGSNKFGVITNTPQQQQPSTHHNHHQLLATSGGGSGEFFDSVADLSSPPIQASGHHCQSTANNSSQVVYASPVSSPSTASPSLRPSPLAYSPYQSISLAQSPYQMHHNHHNHHHHHHHLHHQSQQYSPAQSSSSFERQDVKFLISHHNES